MPERIRRSLLKLFQQFEEHFLNFEVLQPYFRLFSTQFAAEIDNIAKKLQIELAEF